MADITLGSEKYNDNGDGTYSPSAFIVGGNTGTSSSIASATTSTTLLVLNHDRAGATVYNDSTAVLYLLLGSGTASTTNYSVQVIPNGYYEVPFYYQGAIKGIWASANGAARVTELS